MLCADNPLTPVMMNNLLFLLHNPLWAEEVIGLCVGLHGVCPERTEQHHLLQPQAETGRC